jgi:hypothetical protein
MRISNLLIAVLFLFSISKASSAVTPEYAKPRSVYQKQYDMSFFVWKPLGLPGKWHATYDGYPVVEIAKDQWVYGVFGHAGQLTESLINVGAVDPNTVYILAPLPSFQNEELYSKFEFAQSLKKVFQTKCDNFSIAYTKVSPTPIAWESGTSKVYMWGGKRWVQIHHRPTEKLSHIIKNDSYNIAKMLKTCKIVWTQIDTFELANLIKSAGYNWIDNFETNIPPAFGEIGDKTGDGNYDGNVGKNSGELNDPGSIGGGGWDTGKDNP